MIAVIFEARPHERMLDRYLELAAGLRPSVEALDGFISIERFQSLADPRRLLSLSFFRDEQAVAAWRSFEAHRSAQCEGRAEIFADYRLRVAAVTRDYGVTQSAELATASGASG